MLPWTEIGVMMHSMTRYPKQGRMEKRNRAPKRAAMQPVIPRPEPSSTVHFNLDYLSKLICFPCPAPKDSDADLLQKPFNPDGQPKQDTHSKSTRNREKK